MAEKNRFEGKCSSDSIGSGSGYESSSMYGGDHKSPETPKFKLEIVENDIPENWWDKLPDLDPRVYDAILMEQARACVKYIFDDLPDIHELENKIESNKNASTIAKLKTQVPKTKAIKPTEIIM